MVGVTKLSSNATRIKVGDNGSTIKVVLSNVEEKSVSSLQHIRLTPDYESYIEVTDYTLAENTIGQATTPVMIRLPNLPKGVYEVEIMDSVGRIYPAEGRLEFDVIRSLEGGKQTVFVDYQEEIIGELPTIVSDHMTANAELYKGAKGDRGEPFEYEDFTVEQLEGLRVPQGDISIYDINKNKGKLDQSYMTTEFLEQMAGTAPVNAVPSRGGIVSNHLSKRLVNPTHLNFVIVSDNMLNSSNLMISTSIDYTTGEPAANDYHDLSDFIPADGNRDYVFNHVGRWATYDEGKGFIETGTASSITTPENAYFIRLIIAKTRTKEAQMNEGSTLLPYDKYKVELKRTDENGFLIKPSQKTVDKEAMLKDSVSPYALEIIKKPNNLFNMHDVTFGKAISSADELVDDETMVTMNEYITVEPNETLAKPTNTSAIVAFYDIDKQIGGRTAINMDVPNFTTPNYCHYMKISVKIAANDWFMLNRGDTVLPYEDYEFTFQSTDKYPLRIEGAAASNDNISPFRSYNYEQGTYAELVDSLADTGCTVEQLGISSDGVNNLYGIHYGDLVNKPTVLIVGAQHGSEWLSAHYPVEFMRRIAQSDYYDEDIINSLRDTFGFYCIVAANPYGYENVSYTNANGVNLNRNWDNNWESYEVTHSSQEKGTAPFSEPETQIIRDKFLELQPILAFDCHTTGETPGGIDIGGSTSPHRDLLLEADKELRQIFDDASLSTQQWNSTGAPTMSGWVRNQTSKEGITPVHGMVEQPMNYKGDYGLTALFHLTLKVKELYESL